MFVYLSKKIAIPNGIKLRTVSWFNDQGWIACGGEDGLLKVLKLDSPSAMNLPGEAQPPTAGDVKSDGTTAKAAQSASAQSNLSMNQTLEGHSGAVVVSTWNFQHRKLTSSDQNGLIIVWILYKGMWYEEMINNRNKSVVSDMQWNRDGQKICIVYEDGAVIVGSVDGNRIWGKELKGIQLAFTQWSPDSKFIVFATGAGELQLYDGSGNYVRDVSLYCSENGVLIKVAGLEWYNGINGFVENRVPCLAVCFENGKIQIMRDEKDNEPILVDTNMRHLKMKWNHNGSLLAVSGIQYARSAQGEEKEVSVVQFYDPYGQYIRSLKVPGKRIACISWEWTGLRLALAVDSFIYFANIRTDYKWCFFSDDVLVYAFTRSDRNDTTLVFWNTKTHEKHHKTFSRLLLVTSFGENCLLVSKSEDPDTQEQFVVMIVNAIGTALDTKFLHFQPTYASLTKQHAFIGSADIVVFWQFKSSSSAKLFSFDAMRKKDGREKSFHIDDITSIGNGDSGASIADLRSKRPSKDPIVDLTASDSVLLIARESGQLMQFIVPSVTLDSRYSLPFRPQSIALNCDSTKLSIVDISGIMKLFALERHTASQVAGMGSNSAGKAPGGKLLDFERKDVWDVKWADDNPDLFAIMEKTRMYVFRGLDPEEPVTCAGYMCSFSNLQIKIALLDDLMKVPDSPIKEHLLSLETKSLRDTRSILNQVGLPDAVQFVENNPHSRLWKLVADAALEQLDFNIAKKGFLRCLDYQGLQFLKKVQKLDDKSKQMAEVAIYFGRFDAAEKQYLEMDRKDLAVDLRILLGDWFRVVQLIKSGGGAGDDVMLDKAWNSIGDYYFDRQRWNQAVTYYTQARNVERQAECFYLLEDYENLEKLVQSLSENNLLLKDIAEKFITVGTCEPAVQAYIKLGDIKSAVETCVFLNQWNTAITLAERHKIKEIEVLLAKYAEYLLEKDRKFQAIELYRKANYCHKSAKLLHDMATDAAKSEKNPMKVKKLFVLAALEVERYHLVSKSMKGPADSATAALDGLLAEDMQVTVDTRFLHSAWRGAEAYHFYMLAQRQFYEGNHPSAVRTALHLRDYEDIIESNVVYSLIALTSFHNKSFGTCSKAFIKLESQPEISEEQRKKFEELGLNIFIEHPPFDPRGSPIACSNCSSLITENDTYCSNCQINFPICIASGRPIVEAVHFMCHVCKHRAIGSEIAGMLSCPLCHTPL